MRAKLIKKEKGYALVSEDGTQPIGSTLSNKEGHKLSLQNCQAIERRHDYLDVHSLFLQAGKEYLGDSFDMLSMDVDTHQIALVAIKKALEILGDKKFSEGDVKKAINEARFCSVHDEFGSIRFHNEDDKIIQSIKQIEWNVEVEMDSIHETYNDGTNKIVTFPKRNKDGCLILKSI
jgi:hypothetical protein